MPSPRTACCVQVSGVPVVKSKDNPVLLGILSKKDTKKAGTYVKDVYSSPPIAARPENKVADAAVMMLKHKVGARCCLLNSCYRDLT